MLFLEPKIKQKYFQIHAPKFLCQINFCNHIFEKNSQKKQKIV